MKKLIALMLAAIIALSLSGCKKEEEPEIIPNPIATITMLGGDQMRFELKPEFAPNTVANFVNLANGGFYDGLEIFRVVAGVLVQSGDPRNDGTGDPGYAIRGEFAANGFENSLSHNRGVISMARQSHYDSAGSQFFIMQGSYPEYDGQYAAFGVAADAETLNVLDEIASQPVDGSHLPLNRQIIQSIRVDTFDVEFKPETTQRPTYEEEAK